MRGAVPACPTSSSTAGPRGAVRRNARPDGRAGPICECGHASGHPGAPLPRARRGPRRRNQNGPERGRARFAAHVANVSGMPSVRTVTGCVMPAVALQKARRVSARRMRGRQGRPDPGWPGRGRRQVYGMARPDPAALRHAGGRGRRPHAGAGSASDMEAWAGLAERRRRYGRAPFCHSREQAPGVDGPFHTIII